MEVLEQQKSDVKDNKRELYERQVSMLKLFLQNGAISKAQFDKSFGDLTIKMGYKEKDDNE